ncbi:hypothetical protein ACHAWO_002180 [Cyclotella atomus]|uniref:Uncharacterized protein n=1 Tax=Cyclotella atomus TaxID=382360 RepID=A0ABD3P0S3_9STRA
MSKQALTQQGLKFGGRTLNEEELWHIVEKIFYQYDKAKLGRAFVHHHQVACGIYNNEGGNEHNKLIGARHFNGNLHVRQPIGVRYIETLEEDEVPRHKQGETLKYSSPNVDHLELEDYLSEEELNLIASETVEVAGNKRVELDYDSLVDIILCGRRR